MFTLYCHNEVRTNEKIQLQILVLFTIETFYTCNFIKRVLNVFFNGHYNSGCINQYITIKKSWSLSIDFCLYEGI